MSKSHNNLPNLGMLSIDALVRENFGTHEKGVVLNLNVLGND